MSIKPSSFADQQSQALHIQKLVLHVQKDTPVYRIFFELDKKLYSLFTFSGSVIRDVFDRGYGRVLVKHTVGVVDEAGMASYLRPEEVPVGEVKADITDLFQVKTHDNKGQSMVLYATEKEAVQHIERFIATHESSVKTEQMVDDLKKIVDSLNSRSIYTEVVSALTSLRRCVNRETLLVNWSITRIPLEKNDQQWIDLKV